MQCLIRSEPGATWPGGAALLACLAAAANAMMRLQAAHALPKVEMPIPQQQITPLVGCKCERAGR